MNYKSASDLELWEYCRQDDIQAYNALFRRYAKKLFIQASRYVASTMDAEELVMDLMLNIWQKRAQLQIDGEIKFYLYRAIHNRVINYLRRNIPVTHPIDLLEEDKLVESRQADYRMVTGDLNKVYQEKLQVLSPQRRKVFLLSREENLTYPQIAKLLNLSVNTVENHMVAALNTLRENSREFTALLLLIFWV